MKAFRYAAFFAVIGFVLAAACAPGAAAQDQQQPETKAQKKAEAQLRVVHGTVIDKQENPVPSSVVYLKNLKTLAVKTYIADDTASYRFSGLDPNVDYEIFAEHNDLTSPTRTISNFDTRRDLELTLKLTKTKSNK
ncbi:MAG: carboxypeptidase-like regulatory domain-containing protein [Candidatus Acidiferrales bacterium]